jgi:hypothetical protein
MQQHHRGVKHDAIQHGVLLTVTLRLQCWLILSLLLPLLLLLLLLPEHGAAPATAHLPAHHWILSSSGPGATHAAQELGTGGPGSAAAAGAAGAAASVSVAMWAVISAFNGMYQPALAAEVLQMIASLDAFRKRQQPDELCLTRCPAVTGTTFLQIILHCLWDAD